MFYCRVSVDRCCFNFPWHQLFCFRCSREDKSWSRCWVFVSLEGIYSRGVTAKKKKKPFSPIRCRCNIPACNFDTYLCHKCKIEYMGPKLVIYMFLICLPCIVLFKIYLPYFAICFIHGTICLTHVKHWCCLDVFHHRIVLYFEKTCVAFHI